MVGVGVFGGLDIAWALQELSENARLERFSPGRRSTAECGSHLRARLGVPRPNQGLTTVVTDATTRVKDRVTTDAGHSREYVVRTGRTSSSLGREPEPPRRSPSGAGVGGSPSEPRSHERVHCKLSITVSGALREARCRRRSAPSPGGPPRSRPPGPPKPGSARSARKAFAASCRSCRGVRIDSSFDFTPLSMSAICFRWRCGER